MNDFKDTKSIISYLREDSENPTKEINWGDGIKTIATKNSIEVTDPDGDFSIVGFDDLKQSNTFMLFGDFDCHDNSAMLCMKLNKNKIKWIDKE